MSLVTTAEVEARLAPGIDEDALQDLIDAQESYLARKIGALVGERTITYTPKSGLGPILLARTGAVATVTVNGRLLEATEWRQSETELTLTGWFPQWSGTVAVKYTPDDADDVREAVIEMVRVALAASPYNSESGDGHSFSMSETARRQRAQIVRTLMPNRGPHSVPMR